MNRRDFIEKTSVTAGGIVLMPSFAKRFTDEAGLEITSALDTKLRVHVINTTTLHSDAWEGSCRSGELKNLTFDAEKNRMDETLQKMKKDLASLKLHPNIELVEPISLYGWAEKGNPDIIVPGEQLDLLLKTDPQTDLYVVTFPFEGWKIAERFKKPVVILQEAGWAVDMIPLIRRMGLPSFHVSDYDELLSLLDVFYARKAVQNTRILTITNFPNRLPFGLLSDTPDVSVLETRYGVENKFMDYNSFFNEMNTVERDGNHFEKSGNVC